MTSKTETELPVSSTETKQVDVNTAEFNQLEDSGMKNSNTSMNRFRDIRVTVTAEIGNVSMPIGEILELNEGSVIELDKPISAPIDLMAQGVRIARGEVVVVDDCFAIRIKEIDSPLEPNA
jgi:flagellar motor switch protein FliN/FliY